VGYRLPVSEAATLYCVSELKISMQESIVMKLAKYIGLLVVVFPVAVYAFVKPAKILLPEVAGVECIEAWLCVDDAKRAKEAEALYEASVASVESKLTIFDRKPRFVFCSTMKCFTSFGFNKSAGQSIGGFGVVIGPRGWKNYYVEHELIHQWQSLNFGVIRSWLAPEWIIEGMAYSLSDDPRAILHEPFQTYREKYSRAFGRLGGEELKHALESVM
jgi:hypothetical protein